MASADSPAVFLQDLENDVLRYIMAELPLRSVLDLGTCCSRTKSVALDDSQSWIHLDLSSGTCEQWLEQPVDHVTMMGCADKAAGRLETLDITGSQDPKMKNAVIKVRQSVFETATSLTIALPSIILHFIILHFSILRLLRLLLTPTIPPTSPPATHMVATTMTRSPRPTAAFVP